ncbi:MAG TPA: copper chaperone PCu(A)C [Aquabacterium sp.]|nr:copper chaperone PCu(A)C [Aquabacterium sp.]
MQGSFNAAARLAAAFATGATLLIGAGLHSAHAAEAPQAAEATSPAVKVEGAWIRATVKGQQGTGGFMDLTATRSMTLVGFETKVAKHAEVHEMAMDGNVMRMRALDALPLPAGTTVSLKPGSYHLMLMDLSRQLADGETVPVTLVLKSEDGKTVRQTVNVPVKAPQIARPHDMHHGH